MQEVSNSNRAGSTPSYADPESVEFNVEELAAGNFDPIRWINAALKTFAIGNADGAETDAELEERVTKLYNRLHSYSQEVASSVDDTITQALVRLPRTGLEVGRMVAEVQQLQQSLCAIKKEAQPAVEVASKPCVAQLNNLKKTQDKLTRCSETLKKASEVDINMKQLDDIMEKLQRSPSDVDIDSVATSLSEVRRSLEELQKLEVMFGGKQLEAVERHEQLLQRITEVECMEQLKQREVGRAAHLLKVLDTIGRADAVLQRFSAESINDEKEKAICLLRHPDSNASTPSISPTRASELLKTQLVPALGYALANQLDYFLQLAGGSSGDAQGADKTCEERGEARARAVRVLQSTVDEVVECLDGCLTPILQCAERNAELVTCFEAVRELGIKADFSYSRGCVSPGGGDSTSCWWDEASAKVNAHARTRITHIFKKPTLLEAFAQREAKRVESLSVDPQCVMKYDRFQLVMNALADAVKTVIHFFPSETLPMCVDQWKLALLQLLTFLQPTPHTPQTELLERLSVSRNTVRQLLFSTQKLCEDYLRSPKVQQMYPNGLESVKSQLAQQLWAPLSNVLEVCAAECQQAVKQTVIRPVVAAADGYESQSLWGTPNGGDAGHPTAVTQSSAHLAPSELVRGFGEAIVEIPLALEALRGSGGAHLDGIEELFEEVTECWLDDIVRTAVADFVEQKVANITMCFPPGSDDAASVAMEQLVTDLSYLKSILAAVSDDPFERLENVLARLTTVVVRSGNPIVIRDLISAM